MTDLDAPCILVVDDEPEIRLFIADVLSDEGYRVLTAADGAAALELLEQPDVPRPFAILLDVFMPVMDGWAFWAAYRQLPAPQAAVVVMTAAREATQPALVQHAAAVLTKPFGFDELRDALTRLRTPGTPTESAGPGEPAELSTAAASGA